VARGVLFEQKMSHLGLPATQSERWCGYVSLAGLTNLVSIHQRLCRMGAEAVATVVATRRQELTETNRKRFPIGEIVNKHGKTSLTALRKSPQPESKFTKTCSKARHPPPNPSTDYGMDIPRMCLIMVSVNSRFDVMANNRS